MPKLYTYFGIIIMFYSNEHEFVNSNVIERIGGIDLVRSARSATRVNRRNLDRNLRH